MNQKIKLIRPTKATALYFITLLIIALTFPLFNACEDLFNSGKREGIEGDYRAEGTNPDGSRYTGTVTIEKNGAIYDVHWEVGSSYDGVGTLEGNTFTVEWGQPSPVIYTVHPNGTMMGTWNDGAATENLYPN
ncbi:MAG: fibronectin-binding protein [Leptospiraceae bacterium]|nr:fibronectin-binding protein [Leptospiraceae bacterium]